jgi:hypothetical protein
MNNQSRLFAQKLIFYKERKNLMRFLFKSNNTYLMLGVKLRDVKTAATEVGLHQSVWRGA